MLLSNAPWKILGFLLQVEAVCANLLVDTDYVLGFVLCNLDSDIQLSLKYCINV